MFLKLSHSFSLPTGGKACKQKAPKPIFLHNLSFPLERGFAFLVLVEMWEKACVPLFFFFNGEWVRIK